MVTSAPQTPEPYVIGLRPKARFLDSSHNVEWPDLYRPGGFCPIQFGALLYSGKYRVIRKLGHGSFSTVWLAVSRQKPTYVAIKVVMAVHSASTAAATELQVFNAVRTDSDSLNSRHHIVTPIETFYEESPNGRHLCQVFPPMGESVESMLSNHGAYSVSQGPFSPTRRYPIHTVKRIIKDTLEGLAFLHKRGIVHADIQPGNLVFEIKSLDDVDEKELAHDSSIDESRKLQRKDGKADRWAPEYLTSDRPLHESVIPDASLSVNIADFGAAFLRDKQPEAIVTPVALRAPEIILRQDVDEKIDIWSVGCLVYELLTGLPLFAVAETGPDDKDATDDDHMVELNDVLGDLPVAIMQNWKRSDDWFGPNRERLNPRWEEFEEFNKLPTGSSIGEGENCSAENPRITGFKYPLAIGHLAMEISPSLEVAFHQNKPSDLLHGEETQVICLLRQCLQYDPLLRPSADKLLQAEWLVPE